MFKFIPLKQIHSCHKTQLPPAEITCAKLGIKRGIFSSQLCCWSVVQEVSLPNAFLFILTFVTHPLKVFSAKDCISLWVCTASTITMQPDTNGT